MASTGSGDAAAVETVQAATEGSLQRSTRRAKRRTGKTAALTLEQALEILQQSLLEFQLAGGGVLAIKNDTEHGVLAIVLANVYYCQHCNNLSAGNSCQHNCQNCQQDAEYVD